jgi:hypothetical protein
MTETKSNSKIAHIPVKKQVDMLKQIGYEDADILSMRLSCHLDKVEVKETLYGKGVFAKCDIQEGEMITLYPGDVIETISEGHSTLQKSPLYEEKVKKEDVNLHDYRLQISKDCYIMSHPLLIDDPSYLGHMINDGVNVLQLYQSAKEENVQTLNVKKYYEETCKTMNCNFAIHDGLLAYAEALRDIKKGEELYTTYSHVYWNRKFFG